jgi:hypothetical protein
VSARVWNVAVVVLANIEAETPEAAEGSLLVTVNRALRADRTEVAADIGTMHGIAPFAAEPETVADWTVPS